MPVYATGQKHRWDQPAYNFYHFPEQHKASWMKFWEAMGGDEEKILDFAKKSDIKSPVEWFESLHRYLFDFFSGNPQLMKQAASKNFQEYLKTVAQNHTKNPKPKAWYTAKGITVDSFIRTMTSAAEIKDVQQAVAYVNARVMDLGFYLYSEFVLSKTEVKDKIKTVASNTNKEAYDLEVSALGESPLRSVKPKDKISYAFCPEALVVEQVVYEDPAKKLVDVIVAKNSEGQRLYIEDVWNIDNSWQSNK